MQIHLFTDGACQPNPGNGGWAFIVYPEDCPNKRTAKSGFEQNTTNNRMEITAVLRGLQYLEKAFIDPEITLFSDSKYIVQSISSWMRGWARNGWKKKDKKPVLNVDLWKEMLRLVDKLSIKCVHVKGHSGHPENEECDQLAVKEIQTNVSK